MSITYPEGFSAWGLKAGIKPSGKPDLAMIARTGPAERASSAMVFTRSVIVGAPVIIGREIRAALMLPPAKDGRLAALRAVLINAGNSNSATGAAGVRDARACMEHAAGLLGCEAREVLPSSTGIIGRPLAVGKITDRLGELVASLSRGAEADRRAAEAIMTTDMRPKTCSREVVIDGVTVRIGAIAKGSGMIAPRLDSAFGPASPAATMLAFITTDAFVASADLQAVLERACAGSFERISVDNHPSCSDTVVCVASGACGGAQLRPGAAGPGGGSGGFEAFAAALAEVCDDLALQVIRDGEGATRVFRVRVRGAASDADAACIAREVVNSPLVKCAIHGRDPNWGRLVTAAGNAGIAFDPAKTSLTIGGVEVFRAGVPITPALSDPRLKEAMGGDRVECELTVGDGPGAWFMLGCDLSKDYVSINADYTT
jgi:glutamate N-acetyltransferase/amino-acid N-acetyltransferase